MIDTTTHPKVRDSRSAVAALMASISGQPGQISSLTGRNEAHATETLTRVRFLVVDDNDANRFVIAAMLDELDADFVMFEDAASALEAFDRDSFDAALVDIRMPGMDGPAMACQVREIEAASGLEALPLVACSANVMPQQIESYLSGPFDRYLAKPISLDALQKVIDWVRDRPDNR